MPQGQNMPEVQQIQNQTAQQRNIMVAKLVAAVVRTTLGPKGMDKMLVDSMGDVTVTNDGVTILREMTLDHPTAKMMVEIAKTQEIEVGDGTTTAVILAGELLRNAEQLLYKKIHPTIIAKGYKLAAAEAMNILYNMAQSISPKDKDTLIKIAQTAMTGKGAEDARDKLAEVVVESVLKIASGNQIDLNDIKIETKSGASTEDTEIVEGIVMDKQKAHPNMPEVMVKARIALIDAQLELKDVQMDAKININSPVDMQAFIDAEAQIIKTLVDKIITTGANVVFCTRNIDDAAVHFMARAGIMAFKRCNREDLEKLSKATKAKIVTDISEMTKEDIGSAGKVEEVRVGLNLMTFVRECTDAKSVTILVRGSTDQVASEAKRAIEDALGDLAAIIKDGKAVGGAGAPEMILSKELSIFAKKHPGRIQLAIEAFARSLESIPETLAENAGLDPIDILTELRAASSFYGDSPDIAWPGVNVFTGKIMNSWKEGVIEPLRVKTQAVSSAAEVATMVLRIDDVISIMKNPNDLQQK